MLSAFCAGGSAANSLPVATAAGIYSRGVNTAENSTLCGCWRLLRGGFAGGLSLRGRGGGFGMNLFVWVCGVLV